MDGALERYDQTVIQFCEANVHNLYSNKKEYIRESLQLVVMATIGNWQIAVNLIPTLSEIKPMPMGYYWLTQDSCSKEMKEVLFWMSWAKFEWCWLTANANILQVIFNFFNLFNIMLVCYFYKRFSLGLGNAI